MYSLTAHVAGFFPAFLFVMVTRVYSTHRYWDLTVARTGAALSVFAPIGDNTLVLAITVAALGGLVGVVMV
jgi:hypothetical protein